ncbi:hypothetical protein PTSG_06426 [Salpingoeca rosetta]|uniref:WSC domain-containing protein n=1 Tax=Salpingoeca rosetta (strain ATCC 50818 / BSB-021) TaxID=946362 RepID=F2UFS2_SALR5|nr:uncharacterized protein PTSG_06426 [Salpingoeca rosetta]EGD75350.1 hypothetical protein PTSG_06426 [Salpingoeca rosetta]|eukprot:XP_004991807.1 hypothetical protein PTSG_06426 [Salpingoeca rosetta]
MAQTSMTREACATLCYTFNFSLSAVEYGYQCFCGTQAEFHRAVSAPSSDCNEPCTGASTEMCGAANRMNIIQANCSGKPLPTGHACLSAATKELPFCNASLSIGARLNDLIGRLSLQEKAGLVGPDPVTSPCAFLDYGVKRLDIPPYVQLVETNTAVASACIISQDKCATTFIEAHRSWRSRQPSVISTEMRAFNNLNWHRGGGVLQKIGLTGHFLSGDCAAAYLAGCQNGPDRNGSRYGHASTLTHACRDNRVAFNGNISTSDLWDTEAQALAAMCSYASINGVPSPCANNMLLNDVVRGQWKRDMTPNGGVDMELGETYFTTNGYLAQAVKQTRTTMDTMHNAASTSARPADPSLTSSNARCISECPDGKYELGQRQPHQSRIAHCPLDYFYAKAHRCVPCTTCGMGTWASIPCSASSDAVCSPWTECKPGQKSVSGNAVRDDACVSCTLGMEYQPLSDRASCFSTSMCEDPFIETIPPTLTTDRLCSCDTFTCNKLITQLFEEMVCAEPTDEQLDVVLDVCCPDQGEDGIRDTIRQMDAYEARHSCPGCTDTCECSAGSILVYDADSADCRPCDGVTEFSPSIGGSKCAPIEECERGQEEVSAPTRCSSDRVCRDCPAGTIDADSDGSTGCQMCPASHYTEAGSHGSCSSFTCHASTHDHHDSDPATPCNDVTECAPGFEQVQAMTLLISDRVCDEKLEGTDHVCSQCELGATFKPVERPGRVMPPRHSVRECEFGTFQSQVPTLDSNRECTLECSECPSGRFEIRACSALEDVQCAGCSACPPNTYILRACDSGERRLLPAYRSAPCTATSDTEVHDTRRVRPGPVWAVPRPHANHGPHLPRPDPVQPVDGVRAHRLCHLITKCDPGEQRAFEHPPQPPTPSASRAPSAPPTTTATRSPPASRAPYGHYVPAGSIDSCEQFLCPAGTADLDRNARLAWTLPPSLAQRDCTDVTECDLGCHEGMRPTMRLTILTDPPVLPRHRGPVLQRQQHRLLHTRRPPPSARTASARWATRAPTTPRSSRARSRPRRRNTDICSPWTQCSACATEYELVAPSLVNDRECQHMRSCKDTEREVSAPTATTDRLCATMSDAFNALAGTQSRREAFEAALGTIIATVASINEDFTARLFNRSVSGDITDMGFTASKCEADAFLEPRLFVLPAHATFTSHIFVIIIIPAATTTTHDSKLLKALDAVGFWDTTAFVGSDTSSSDGGCGSARHGNSTDS